MDAVDVYRAWWRTLDGERRDEARRAALHGVSPTLEDGLREFGIELSATMITGPDGEARRTLLLPTLLVAFIADASLEAAHDDGVGTAHD